MATYNTNGVTSVPADEEDKIVSSGLGSKPSRSSRARTADVSDNEVNPVAAMFRDIAARFTSAGATLSAPTRPKASTYRPDSGGSIYDGEMFDVPAGVPAPLDRNVDVSAIDSALENAFSNAAVPQLYLATLGDPQPETTIDVAALRAPDPITVTEITVKAGDTLTAIAKDNGVPVQDVIDANPQIKNPNMIRPGDVVSVPDPRFEDVPKPRGVPDSPRLSDSTVTPTGTTTEPRDGPVGLMSPPAQDAVPEVDTSVPIPAEEAEAVTPVADTAATTPTRDELIDSVFDAEGGYSTDRDDTGNYYRGQFVGTNHGISAPVLAEHLGRTPTVEDMRGLTQDTAREIAATQYYDAYSISDLPDETQEIVFHAVYMGGSRGVRAVQNLTGSTPDGVMGPNTRTAMQESTFTPQEFRDEYLRELEFGTTGYSSPAATWNVHGRGWSNRYNELASE